MALILVVDDVAPLAEQYAYDLKRLAGHEVLVAANGAAALALLAHQPVDCALLDLEMPGMDGLEVLAELNRTGSEVPVIVYTAAGDFDRCIAAVRLGAYGFVSKDEPMERIVHEIATALERRALRQEVAALRERLGDSELLGTSPALLALREQVARLAPLPATVLITGESGTGKELVARDLHRFGAAPAAPFIAVNAAALPDTLVESELFGHEKGAFTGAVAMRRGAFEAAGTGTLFLDEVGELPLAAQATLLRVLESREVTRLGATKPVPVACRVVAATHRDLDTEVREGRFREDLLYRLNAHQLMVPPLRDRPADIPLLATHFVEAASRRFGMLPRRIAPEAMDLLRRWEFRRNNVRELRNMAERMVVAADGEVIRVEHLPREVAGDATSAEDDQSFQGQRAAAERRIIEAALARHGGHLTRTAEWLGLADHASLIKIMKRLGMRG